MKLILNILSIFVICAFPLFCQGMLDSCNCEVNRILMTYERLKTLYEKHAFEKLLYYLNSDDTLKTVFLSKDTIILKQLQVKLIPVLKLDNSARNYRFPENLCKYFVFDTITYDCEAAFYVNNKELFYVDREWNECYYPDILPLDSYTKVTNDFRFSQNYYQGGKYCEHYYRNFFSFFNDRNEFVFAVDNLSYFRIIDLNLSFKIPEWKNWNNIERINLNENFIRFCARRCYAGGPPPWWKFWEWNIFYKNP